MIVGLTFQRGLYGKKGAMRQSIRSTLSAATGSSAPVRRTVTVVLLNKEELQILVEPKGKVADAFNQVCNHLGLRETEYFSLAQFVDGEYHFVDLDQKVSKLAPKSWRSHHNSDVPVIKLYFRVQFYVDHVMLLRERVTRHQYYLQLRDNMLHASQLCAEERCFQLAAYALQADLGSYNTHKHARSYFDPREYFPAWVISKHGSEYIVTSMPAMHSDLSGMTKMEAQMQYIKDVSASPAAHNLHFYRLKKRKTDALGTAWLGICPKGIEIYEEIDQGFKSLLSTFLWSSIGKLYFEKKKFEIRAVGCPTGRKFTYYTGSDERSKYLLHLCRTSHLFQMTVQPKLAEIRHLEAEDKRRFRESHREAYIYSDRQELDRDKGRGSSWSGRFSQGSSQINGLQNTPRSSVMDQRVSVISNTSSNTTSGIVSDRMYQSFDDSDDDMRNAEIMIDSPPSKLSGYVPGSFKMPNARSTPLHIAQGKTSGISSSPATLNRMGDIAHSGSTASRTHSIVSRSSSGRSQRSGKLTLSPIANISDTANAPSLSRPIPAPIPAEVQIQRISLAPTMTVTSTKVPSSVGPIFSGVATSGSPSLPTYVNVPATSATYVNVSELIGAGQYMPMTSTQPLAASPTNYTTGVTSMVGQTFVVESRPVQQIATPVVPSNMYSAVPSNDGPARQQPVSITPTALAQPHIYNMSDSLPMGNYGKGQSVVQPLLGPGYSLASGTGGTTVDYTSHRSSTPPNYPLKVLSVSTNPPMLVSSHPHVPPGVMPQQCLPVEPRAQMPPQPPLPSQQQQQQQSQQQKSPQTQSQPSHPPHISQQGPPLTPHLHHSAIQATQNPGLTTTMLNPPLCHQPAASPANLIPPSNQIPKVVISQQSPVPLQRTPPPAPPAPQSPSHVPPPGSQNNSPSTSSQPATPPAMANTTQHPMSVIDHSVTVDDTTAGPSTPLTVLPPSSGQTTALPPTTVVTPPETSSKVEGDGISVGSKPVSASPAPSPARGQKGGLVATGEAWGYSNSDNPRAAARHHSMGKYDQLLNPNASRDSESRRRGRRSKTCPVHGMMQDVAAELQILTTKNSSLPLLSALCNDSSLIQQVQEKCSCSATNSQNTSRDEKSSSSSISQMGTMISNEPGTVTRPLSWHSGPSNLDQTLKLFKDEELFRDAGGASPVSPPECKETSIKTVRSSSDDAYSHQNRYHHQRPHSDELASLTHSQLKAAPLIAGLLAPGCAMLEAPLMPSSITNKYTNHNGAMFPSKLTSGGHSPNSSETLHQQASMGLA